MNIADQITIQADARSNATAVISPDGTLSFKQLDLLIWRAATYLKDNEVNCGDTVSLTFNNELLLLICMLATARIGATAYTLPSHYTRIQKSDILAEISANIVLSDHNCYADECRHVLVNNDILLNKVNTIDFRARVENPKNPWLIASGSGTTGKPKIIPYSHSMYYERILRMNRSFSIIQDDRVVSLIHLNYSGCKSRYIGALIAGASIVIYPRTKLHPMKLVKDYDITFLTAAVIHLEQLFKALPQDIHNTMTSLKGINVISSTVNESLRNKILNKLTKNLIITYGCNECSVISMVKGNNALTNTDTVGHILSDTIVEIVDKNDNILPLDEVGRVRVKTPVMIDGYLNNDEATQRAFKNGWFYPGDLGKFTKDGQLIYCGRADHMMIFNGVNIYPAEIEQIITSHPEVKDAAAMPIKSSVHQDIPVCAVVLFPKSKLTEKELLEYAYQHLGIRGPKRIIVLSSIPRNEQGKLIRQKLVYDIKHKLTAPYHVDIVAKNH